VRIFTGTNEPSVTVHLS